MLGAKTVSTQRQPLVRQATAPCLDGTYRTVVRAKGSAFGDIKTFADAKEAAVTCK